jgi:iron complex outermembrane receptor protein
MFGVSAFDFEVENVSITPGNVKDVEPSFAPRLQMAGLARYAWPMFTGEMAIQADANYHSNFYHNLNNFAANKYPAAVIGNVRLTWVSADETWQLTGFVNNVADERNPTIGFDLAGLCGCNEDAYGKPRWYGVTARYNWK